MAEGVFRSLSSSDPRISSVDSCGTGAYHTGDSPDPRTISVLETNGIVDYEHGARKIQTNDFMDFDYILAMDRENLKDLQRMQQRVIQTTRRGGESKVMLFGDFGGRKGEIVVDPYYGARNGFDIAYEQMVRFSKGFLSQLSGRGEQPPVKFVDHAAVMLRGT